MSPTPPQDRAAAAGQGRGRRSIERTILRYRGGEWTRRRDRVTTERPLYLEVNGRPFLALLCTPVQRRELAVGFLLAEGFVHRPEQIVGLDLDDPEDRVRVEIRDPDQDMEERLRRVTLTSGCGRGTLLCDVLEGIEAEPVADGLRMAPEQVLARMHELHRRSATYLETGGTHSAAVTDGERILAFAEDLGRHNAVDKVLGACFLRGIATHDKAVLASGRISSEIILKAARSRVPILATRAAATDQVIRIAETLGITLVGFTRGGRMNVYTRPERLNAPPLHGP